MVDDAELVAGRVAQRHITVAQKLCERWWIDLPDRDLAYLVEGTDEFWAHLRDLRWAQHFALLNREELMDRVLACLGNWMGTGVEDEERINCHHNFTQREKHFGKEVWVSRKGAIEAKVGQPGLIPGSMGTASYVVVGKGDPLSLNSSPHGAGRQYSRSAARRQFTVDDLRSAMVGIEYRDTDAFVDEISWRLQGHRPGDGGRRRPGRGPSHAASGRQRQGRLSGARAGRVRGGAARRSRSPLPGSRASR